MAATFAISVSRRKIRPGACRNRNDALPCHITQHLQKMRKMLPVPRIGRQSPATSLQGYSQSISTPSSLYSSIIFSTEVVNACRPPALVIAMAENPACTPAANGQHRFDFRIKRAHLPDPSNIRQAAHIHHTVPDCAKCQIDMCQPAARPQA